MPTTNFISFYSVRSVTLMQVEHGFSITELCELYVVKQEEEEKGHVCVLYSLPRA
jgi:hypothetical protein